MKLIGELLKTCVAGLLALYILSLFLLIYGFSGIHIVNPSHSTDYKWRPRQIKTTMVEGFAWMRFDEYGFNNPDGARSETIDMLLMGSSYLEGANVSQDHNIAAELRNRLTDISIYNIGISGHTIYHCAKNLNAAVTEYNPSKYIVIETNVARPNNNSMLEVLDGKLKDIPSYDSGYLYLIQKMCPAVKSLYKDIQDWRNSEKKSMAVADDEGLENISTEQMDETILSKFLAKMKSDCGDRQLIILYHPETAIDQGGTLFVSSEDPSSFSTACAENGIIFVDMTGDFYALYHSQHRLANGFTNTAVGVGHLNQYGCEVIAERLSQVIKEEQDELK